MLPIITKKGREQRRKQQQQQQQRPFRFRCNGCDSGGKLCNRIILYFIGCSSWKYTATAIVRAKCSFCSIWEAWFDDFNRDDLSDEFRLFIIEHFISIAINEAERTRWTILGIDILIYPLTYEWLWTACCPAVSHWFGFAIQRSLDKVQCVVKRESENSASPILISFWA